MCHVRALQHRQLHRLAKIEICALQKIREVALSTYTRILWLDGLRIVKCEARGASGDRGHLTGVADSLNCGTLVASEQR
jgi:hypothetical protein